MTIVMKFNQLEHEIKRSQWIKLLERRRMKLHDYDEPVRRNNKWMIRGSWMNELTFSVWLENLFEISKNLNLSQRWWIVCCCRIIARCPGFSFALVRLEWSMIQTKKEETIITVIISLKSNQILWGKRIERKSLLSCQHWVIFGHLLNGWIYQETGWKRWTNRVTWINRKSVHVIIVLEHNKIIKRGKR